MIAASDLKPFCGTEETRYYLRKPWSAGEFTYATNGRIAVRVPRLPDVPEMADPPRGSPPNVDSIIPKPEAPRWLPLDARILPAPVMEPCDECEGRGRRHDCPDCGCICGECGGSGEIAGDYRRSLAIGGVPFGLNYVRALLTLPSVEVATPVLPGKVPMLFRFEGGDGVLMPRSEPADDHLDIDLLAPADAPAT